MRREEITDGCCAFVICLSLDVKFPFRLYWAELGNIKVGQWELALFVGFILSCFGVFVFIYYRTCELTVPSSPLQHTFSRGAELSHRAPL